MRRKSSFLPCPVPDMVPGDFQAPLCCARNDREAGISIAPWLAEAQGVTGFAFVSYSHAKHSAESAASRLPPSTAYAVPLPHGWGRQGCYGKCILFMCHAKHSAESAADGGFPPPWCLTAPPSPRWEACHTILRSLSLPYESYSLANPQKRWDNKAPVDLPLCHIVMLSTQLNQPPMAASPFHRLRGPPPPWMGEARMLQRGQGY